MSFAKIGESTFEFPNLCRIFGVSAVRLASVNKRSHLRLLESFLDLCLNKVTPMILETDTTLQDLF